MPKEYRTYAEVDLAQIEENMRRYVAFLPPGTRPMAVVKADAYGHGAARVATRLQAGGCAHFAVATVEEGIALRRVGIHGSILVLGYTPPYDWAAAAAGSLTVSLPGEDYAARLLAKGPPGLFCQFALDTGMHRLGLSTDEPAAAAAVIRFYAARLPLTGLYTHLCTADETNERGRAYTRWQRHRFEAVCRAVADLHLPVHCLNSAGGLYYPEAGGDFARVGIVLYGLRPDPARPLPAGMWPALTWKTVIALQNTLPRGACVGYGAATLTRQSVVATLPVGYADGYPRALSAGGGYVGIGPHRAPVLGRVCMDQMMVDITDLPPCEIGTEVCLLGDGRGASPTADDLAARAGTVGYEIVSRIASRVPRVYR